MTRIQMRTGVVVIVVALAALSSAYAQQGHGKEHTFRGKVEQIDQKGKTLTVNGENVEGWMPAMTMTYAVDKKEVVDKIKVGDEITAKVYDGDQRTLYDVQVAPPKTKK